MGRKKTICSINAALQVDGKVHYTFRKAGQEIGINQLPTGHVGKLYRSLTEVRKIMKKGFNLDYIDKQTQEEEKQTVMKVIRDVFARYPNTPTLNRIRHEIDNAINV